MQSPPVRRRAAGGHAARQRGGLPAPSAARGAARRAGRVASARAAQATAAHRASAPLPVSYPHHTPHTHFASGFHPNFRICIRYSKLRCDFVLNTPTSQTDRKSSCTNRVNKAESLHNNVYELNNLIPSVYGQLTRDLRTDGNCPLNTVFVSVPGCYVTTRTTANSAAKCEEPRVGTQ